MASFVIVYPKCFRGAVVFRFPLGTRSLLPANLKKLKESLNILFYYKNFDYPEKPLKYKHIRRISD